MKLQTITISDIKFDDDTYALTPTIVRKAPAKLVQSISRVGILHPPIIVEIADGIYRIGSGRRRLLAVQELHKHTCGCFVFDASTHPVDVLSYIYEEASHTNLPIISKAIFLKKASKWLRDDELSPKFMPGFDLKEGRFQVKKTMLLADLELNIQEALLHNRIDEKVCNELVKLDFIDRMGLFDIISTLKLSVGNQRKLLISSREIAARSQTPLATFLGQKNLTAILKDQSLNTPQKTTLFMARLQELRFPLLSEAEHDFQQFVTTLPLSPKMQLHHATSFETDQLTLSVICESRTEISELIQHINTKTK